MNIPTCRKTKIALILNTVICILEIIGFVRAFSALGITSLKYYTQLSNLICLIASAAYIFWLLTGKEKEVPDWLRVIKLIGTLSVMVTFIVVVTVLSWTTSMSLWTLLTSGSMLYHHTLCPLLAFGSFLFFEPYRFKKGDAFRALWFTLAYASVTLPLNILRVMNGPYPFLKVYEQPWWASVLWIILILGGNVLLAKLLIRWNRAGNHERG